MIEYLKITIKNKIMKKQSKKKPLKKAVKKTVKKATKKTAPKKGKKAAKKAKKRAIKAEKKIVTTTTTTVTTTMTTKKVQPKETHYLLVLDESSSMGSVRSETLSGLNEQIKTIKNLNNKYSDQDYFVSIVKFATNVSTLIEDKGANKTEELSEVDYTPNGMTALYDAIGIGVNNLKNRIQNKLNSGEASVLVVILTDGEENNSREYNSLKIKNLITDLEKTGLWTFTFIGANQDAILTARNLGVNINNTVNFTASGAGTDLAFASLNSSISKRAMYRSAGVFTNDSYLSEVTAQSSNIGENADLLDLTGTVSAEDLQKAKDALNTDKTSK